MGKPNRTFPAIPNDLRQWTTFLQGLFVAREFTAVLGGCTTSPSGTARYTISAGIVCLALPALSATSNQTYGLITGMPGELTPQHDQQCLARITDNGTTAMGIVQIGTDTGITLFPDIDATVNSFTASGTKGLKASIVVYSLD